jgi:hypothetical protein
MDMNARTRPLVPAADRAFGRPGRRRPGHALAPLACALALAWGLTGCGGGEEDRAAAFTDRIAQAAPAPAADGDGRRQALSGATLSATANDFFDWAQWKWPTLVPAAGSVQIERTAAGQVFDIRVYSTGFMVGVSRSGGGVYVLVPGRADLLVLGVLTDFTGAIVADTCSFRPGSCTPPPTTGSYNDCVDPATTNLPTGFRSRLVFDYSGTITGEQTVDTVVEGADTFRGQPVTRMRSTTTGTNSASGFAVSTTTETQSYSTVVNGLLNTVGSRVKATIGGLSIGGFTLPPTVTETESFYNPPLSNVEFTLQPGQSVTKTSSFTTTILAGQGAGLPPTTVSLSDTQTFEARESISVLGRTWQTCRYRSVSSGEATTTWYIVGRGIPARITSTGQTVQLKSGTVNGAPL